MDDEKLRKVAAEQMATSYLVELLLVERLKAVPAELRPAYAQMIIHNGKRIDHYIGFTPDHTDAEEFSDIVVRMHGQLEGYFERAFLRLEAGQKAVGEQS